MPADPYDQMRDDIAALRSELSRQGMLSAVLEEKLRALERDLATAVARGETVASRYVPLIRYQPVEKVLYGLVGLILVSFVGALLALVVK